MGTKANYRSNLPVKLMLNSRVDLIVNSIKTKYVDWDEFWDDIETEDNILHKTCVVFALNTNWKLLVILPPSQHKIYLGDFKSINIYVIKKETKNVITSTAILRNGAVIAAEAEFSPLEQSEMENLLSIKPGLSKAFHDSNTTNPHLKEIFEVEIVRNIDPKIIKLETENTVLRQQITPIVAAVRRELDNVAPQVGADLKKAQIAWIRKTEGCSEIEKKAAVLRTDGMTLSEIAKHLPHNKGKPMTRQGVDQVLLRFAQKVGQRGLFSKGTYRQNVRIEAEANEPDEDDNNPRQLTNS